MLLLIRAGILLNLIFLAGTWLWETGIFQPASHTLQLCLVQLDLALENVAASWYSSMLLLVTGLLAIACFFADQQEHRKNSLLNYGWLIFSGIFILLSFDEMASIHEVIGEFPLMKRIAGNSDSWGLFYIIILTTAIFMMIFVVSRLYKNKRSLLLAVLGVLLLASNPLQENFEISSFQSSGLGEAWVRPVLYTLLEEGSEIFASLAFFASFAYYLIEKTRKSASVMQLPLIPAATAWGLVAVPLLSVQLITVYAHSLQPIPDNGIAWNWPPAAAFFVLAFIVFFFFNNHVNRQQKTEGFALAILAILASASFGINLFGYLSGFFGILRYALLAISLTTAILLLRKARSALTKTLVLLCVLAMAAAAAASHQSISAMAGTVSSFALMGAMLNRWRLVPDSFYLLNILGRSPEHSIWDLSDE